jgi:hypothetical protein
MVDLFPDQKIDLLPATSQSPDWLAGFPQHAQRLAPIVAGVERVRQGSLELMAHVAMVRELARWINLLFRAAETTAMDSCVELHCTHKGMRTNCVPVELFFQVLACVLILHKRVRVYLCIQTLHLSQRFVLLVHGGQTGSTWLFPDARATPVDVYRARIDFVRKLVGLQMFTLSLFQRRMTDRSYELRKLVTLSELEDYYRYARAYGFWACLHLTLEGRSCSNASAPAAISVEDAPAHTKTLGEAMQMAFECQRTLAEIRTQSFCIGATCVVPIVRALPLENKRIKSRDESMPALMPDARWEALVHPMVLSLRAEWASCCGSLEVQIHYIFVYNQ